MCTGMYGHEPPSLFIKFCKNSRCHVHGYGSWMDCLCPSPPMKYRTFYMPKILNPVRRDSRDCSITEVAFEFRTSIHQRNSRTQVECCKLWDANPYRRDLSWHYCSWGISPKGCSTDRAVSLYCFYLNSDKLLNTVNFSKKLYIYINIYIMNSISYYCK